MTRRKPNFQAARVLVASTEAEQKETLFVSNSFGGRGKYKNVPGAFGQSPAQKERNKNKIQVYKSSRGPFWPYSYLTRRW